MSDTDIFELFVRLKESNTSLHYIDEEDSVIPIDSTWELQEAVRLAKVNRKPIKFFLTKNKSQANCTMSLNVNKNECEESLCNEGTPVPSNKKTCPKLYIPKPKENVNNNTPPDWFLCYMKKFKKDLISEVKTSIVEAVENSLKKKKKLSYLKAEDLLYEKNEAFSSDKTQTRKKKKMSEKDSVDATDHRGLKVKKLEKLFPTKSEKLEKLDNKSKLLLEEKRKILEKKRSAKSKTEKTSLDSSEKKYSLQFSASFEEPDIYLNLLPEEDFAVSLKVINNGMYSLNSSKLECFDFTEFRPDSLYMIIPKMNPGDKQHITLRGKACKTIGLHHFKCRVVEDLKIISPEFTCYARVESNEPQGKQSDVFFKTYDVVDTVRSSKPMSRSYNSNDMIGSSEKKIQENIVKIKERLHHIGLIEHPCQSMESEEPFNTSQYIMADEHQFLNERPKVINAREKSDLYNEMPKFKELKKFIDEQFSIDYMPLADTCLLENHESPLSQFHDIQKSPTADEREEKRSTDDVDCVQAYVREVVEKADEFMKIKKKTMDTEELKKRLYKDLKDKFKDILRKRTSCNTPQSLMTDHENSRLESPDIVKNPMKRSSVNENMAEACREELNTLNDESKETQHFDKIINDSSSISSDSEASLLYMSQDDENFIMVNLPSRSSSPSPTKSVHEVSDNNSDNADKEKESIEFDEQLKSVITKIQSPDQKYKILEEAEIQGVINREGDGPIEEAQVLEEAGVLEKDGDQEKSSSQGGGVIIEEARNLKEKETAKEFRLNSPSPSRSRRSPFGEEIVKSKLKKMTSKSTEYHFKAANLTQPTFIAKPKTGCSGPSKFIFTGEREGMRSHLKEDLEEKPSRFTFTGETGEKAKKEEDSKRRNIPKTDSVGRVIYAVNSSGYCLPVKDLFEIGGTLRRHVSETGDDENLARYERRNVIYNENSGVSLLPNVLMNGASNVASIAFNTAKSVISNLQSAFVTEGKTELGKPAFEEKKKVSLEEAMFTLYEMGFSDLEKNRTLLLEYDNDLRKVVGELVRHSKSSERPH